jgi:hypothetical protein
MTFERKMDAERARLKPGVQWPAAWECRRWAGFIAALS